MPPLAQTPAAHQVRLGCAWGRCVGPRAACGRASAGQRRPGLQGVLGSENTQRCLALGLGSDGRPGGLRSNVCLLVSPGCRGAPGPGATCPGEPACPAAGWLRVANPLGGLGAQDPCGPGCGQGCQGPREQPVLDHWPGSQPSQCSTTVCVNACVRVDVSAAVPQYPHVCMYPCVCAHVCMCMYLCVRAHVCMYRCASAHECMYPCACAHLPVLTCACVCTCA